MIDLGELYQRWQRSTPFQASSKYDWSWFQEENTPNDYLDTNIPTLNFWNSNWKQYLSSEKSRATAEDIDMDVEYNNWSPFSRSSIPSFPNKFRNSDSLIKYPNKFDRHIDTPFKITQSIAQSMSSRSKSGQIGSEDFLIPTSFTNSVGKRLSSKIEKEARFKTITKRNTEKLNFKFS